MKLKPSLFAALDCVGKPESCVIEKLGKPDLDLPGPNSFDKKLVYKKAQLTVEVDLRGTPDDIASGGAPKPGARGPTIWSVGTGAVEKSDHFGGDYDGTIEGIEHGDSSSMVKQRWGNGEASGDIDPKKHLSYPRKFKSSSGEPISADVFFREKSGVYHVSFYLP